MTESEKYLKLLSFIKSISETTEFSTANHWYLAKRVKELLIEIGEID
jgi:hypothetical protein